MGYAYQEAGLSCHLSFVSVVLLLSLATIILQLLVVLAYLPRPWPRSLLHSTTLSSTSAQN